MVVVLLAVCTAARAEDDKGRWYVQIDNDAVFGTDRWYSAGSRISRVQNDIEVGVLQEIYTPDAKNWDFGTRDRVPTARLIASIAKHFHDDGVYQTIELGLGVRGPSALGQRTTQAVHHVISAAHVDWSRQLPDELDAHVAGVRTQSAGTEMLKVHYGAVLGNQVSFAHAGLELRIGDTTLASQQLRFVPTPPFPVGVPVCNWSAYVGVSARAVARNELIGRNYDPFGPDLERKPTIGRVATGFSYRPSWGVVRFDVAWESREFDGQGRPTRFGSLALHIPF
jgi:hypothetical protein